MPFPFLRRERDVRKGIKVSSSILKFHFPVPLPISSLQKGEKGRREIRGQNMPPNFSSTLEDGQRRAQAVGHSPHPAVPSSPEPPPSCRYGLLPVPASASPPLLPGRPLRSAPAMLLPRLPFPPLPEAQRLRHGKELGLGPIAKPPATTGKGNGVCAHICQRLDFLEGIWTLSPPTAASSISSSQLPEVSSPQI